MPVKTVSPKLPIFVLIIVIVALVTLVDSSFADIQSTSLTPLDERVRRIAVRDQHLFVIFADDRLVIYDVSDTSTPIKVSQLLLGTDTAFGEIQFAGDYAYFGSYEGLWIIDISDLSNPTIAGSYTETFGSSMRLDYPFAYVAIDTDTLAILDVSNPSDVLVVAEHTIAGLSGSIAKIDLHNDFILANADSKMWVIDVSTPTQPVEVSSWWLYNGDYFHTQIKNGYLYHGSQECSHGCSLAMTRYDLIDITNPTPVDGIWLSYGFSLLDFEVDFPHIYVAGDISANVRHGIHRFSFADESDLFALSNLRVLDIELVGDTMFAGTEDGIRILDPFARQTHFPIISYAP